MSFWSRLFPEAKASQARQALVMNQLGRAVQSPRTFEAFAKEGYSANGIVFKSVSFIAEACGGIDWLLYRKRKGTTEWTEVDDMHPLMNLLERPNPEQGLASFIESVVAFYKITGNTYIEAVTPLKSKEVIELWSIRPDKMGVIPGPTGLPMFYVFKSGSEERRYPVDVVTGMGNIMHMKTFNPLDAWHGLSPIEVAMLAVDQRNESGKHNLALLQNSGVPSGAMVVSANASNPSGTLKDEQFNRIKDQIQDRIAGSRNAGRILLLEGGLDWKGMGLNAKDMDWLEGRREAAREIALVFGVPPILLNIPGDSTFANYKEARQAFYEDKIIPLMDKLRGELNRWLTARFGDDLYLDYDRDSIEALVEKRNGLFASLTTANFLTVNEKRAMIGFDEIEGGDTLFVPMGQMPLEEAGSLPEDDDSESVTEPEAEGTEEETEAAPESEEGDEEGGDSEEPKPEDEDEKAYHELSLNDEELEDETKQINLLNGDDKQRTWRSVNRRRVALQKAFELDILDDLRDQADDIAKAVKAAGTEPRLIEFAVLKAIDEHTPKIQATLRKHTTRVLRDFGGRILNSGKALGLPLDHEAKTQTRFNDFVLSFAQRRAQEGTTQIQSTTAKATQKRVRKIVAEVLEEELNQDEIARRIEKEVSGAASERATTIARTETTIASNQGALGAAKALDLPDLEKEWISVSDDRTRDDHIAANGDRVGIDESFNVGGIQMESPGDPNAPIEQTINCRCVMGFARGKR